MIPHRTALTPTLALLLALAGCDRAPPARTDPQAAGTGAAGAAVAAEAPAEFARANLLHCPWDPATVAPVTGAATTGVPAAHNAADAYTVHCSYPGRDGRVLEVAQSWFAPGAATAAFAVLDRQLGARAQAVADDPDGARWVTQPGADTLMLVYTRANVRTEIVLRGADAGPELRGALLALPRLPAWR